MKALRTFSEIETATDRVARAIAATPNPAGWVRFFLERLVDYGVGPNELGRIITHAEEVHDEAFGSKGGANGCP